MMAAGASLQIFSDGGLRDQRGAAAFAIYLVDTRTDDIALAAVDAVHLDHQSSAFRLEAIAADRAIQACKDIATKLCRFTAGATTRRRTRFALD